MTHNNHSNRHKIERTIRGNPLSSNLIKAFSQNVFISLKYELVQSNNPENTSVMEQKLCPASVESDSGN